jgi:hypothetical protein
MEPVRHCSHRYYDGTATGAKCDEQRATIEQGERVGTAEEQEAESNDDRSQKDELSRAKPIDKEAYGRGKDPPLQAAEDIGA